MPGSTPREPVCTEDIPCAVGSSSRKSVALIVGKCWTVDLASAPAISWLVLIVSACPVIALEELWIESGTCDALPSTFCASFLSEASKKKMYDHFCCCTLASYDFMYNEKIKS